MTTTLSDLCARINAIPYDDFETLARALRNPTLSELRDYCTQIIDDDFSDDDTDYFDSLSSFATALVSVDFTQSALCDMITPDNVMTFCEHAMHPAVFAPFFPDDDDDADYADAIAFIDALYK